MNLSYEVDKYIHREKELFDFLNKKHPHLVITKSYKDVICLNQHFGINAVAPSSENKIFSEKTISTLQREYCNIFLLYDHDRAGRLFSRKYREKYGVSCLFFPFTMEKDFSDNLEKIGIDRMWFFLAKTISYVEKSQKLYNDFIKTI